MAYATGSAKPLGFSYDQQRCELKKWRGQQKVPTDAANLRQAKLWVLKFLIFILLLSPPPKKVSASNFAFLDENLIPTKRRCSHNFSTAP